MGEGGGFRGKHGCAGFSLAYLSSWALSKA